VINTHRQSAPLIYSLIGACKAIEAASKRIHAWIEAHSFASTGQDSPFFEQLVDSIGVCHIVLDMLRQDLAPYTLDKVGMKSWSRALRGLLNESTLTEHRAILNFQVNSLHLLLATTNMSVSIAVSAMPATVLMTNRPQPNARSLVCDCLRPVFRKDEESAWTIVATGAASSRNSFSSLPNTKNDRRDSICSTRSFAFTNDLLTAPVYKRVALSALYLPKSSQKLLAGGPSTSIGSAADHQTLRSKSTPGSIHESCIALMTKNLPAPTTTVHMNTTSADPVQSAANAASGTFSHSTVTDLKGSLLSSQWLPLRARVRRANLTGEERSKIDAHLLDAVERNFLIEIAGALDAGADINALRPPEGYQTALQLATNTPMLCAAVRFLLHYQDVNIHVRDERGPNLLHNAVRLECEDCIQSLLDGGLSMTDEDENGISAIDFAAQKCSTTRPLSALLRYARNDGVKGIDITALDPHALLKLCCQTPFRREHAHVLVRFGWSLITDGNAKPFPFSRILKNECWLMKEMIEHPKTIAKIRAKLPAWENVLEEAIYTSNTENVIQLLRVSIEFRHLTRAIFYLATTKNHYFLMEFLARHTNEGKSLDDSMDFKFKGQPPQEEFHATGAELAHLSNVNPNSDVRSRLHFANVHGVGQLPHVIQMTPENRDIIYGIILMGAGFL